MSNNIKFLTEETDKLLMDLVHKCDQRETIIIIEFIGKKGFLNLEECDSVYFSEEFTIGDDLKDILKKADTALEELNQ